MLERVKSRAHAATTHIPEKMEAAAIDRFGDPDVLSVHALPMPSIDPGDVLIKIDTAGVGPWDGKIRAGTFAGRNPRFPLVLGTDGAGTVAAVGSRVRRFKVRDKVYSYSWANRKGGFYAQYVTVPADKVAPIPHRMTLEHAGAIATTGLTALQGIEEVLRLKKGESIAIHGASGGVGTLAVQFAKLHGARVLATATRPDGIKLVRAMGADVVVDGRHGDIGGAAREFAPNGLDAVLAFAGGDGLDALVAALHQGGRVAYPSGIEPEPPRRRGVTFTRYDAVSGVRQFERLNRAVEAAKLKVPIAASYPMRQAAKAQQRLAEGHVLGKIVLRVQRS